MDYAGTQDDPTDHDDNKDGVRDDSTKSDECNPASIGGSVKGVSLGGQGNAKGSGSSGSEGLESIATGGDGGSEKGFDNFGQAKKYLGSPGEGKQWHHIVEQCQIKTTRSGFSPQQIHNTRNLVAVDRSVHEQISAHYSSKHPSGGTVRDFLSTQSFEYQYQYGLDILKKYSGE